MRVTNENALYEIVPSMIGLQHECEMLYDWFKKDYSESDLRILCDFNAILHTLRIQFEVLAGEEVSENRLYFKSKPIILGERDLRNEALVYGFLKEFNKQIRLQIQNVFNTHYLREKQRLGIE